MNVSEVQALSDEELRVNVAGPDGWTEVNIADAGDCMYLECGRDAIVGIRPDGDGADVVPNYPQDLNAMHEAYGSLDYCKQVLFVDNLGLVVFGPKSNRNDWAWSDMINATARQRAEAFVLTMTEG